MGQSYEIYNIITSPQLQINSRFVPYYKSSDLIVPTGTMMGELGIKFGNHRLYLNSNETHAMLDKSELDMMAEWTLSFDETDISNEVENGKFYKLTVQNSDIAISFIRKVYVVTGLDRQYHFDYSAKLLSSGDSLHGYVCTRDLADL